MELPLTEAVAESLRRAGLILFFLLLLAAMWGVTHLWLECGMYVHGTHVPGRHLRIVPAMAMKGDEPHYLMVVNSILFDHDLELQDDYERVGNSGLEAGVLCRGINLYHHTIIVNRRTGAHATWMDLHKGDPALISPAEATLLKPSPDLYEVSAHPVAYPALLAALIAPFRPSIEDVEGEASVAMVLISWVTCIVAFVAARRAGMSRAGSVVGVAILALASPWLPYARSYYSEPVIGLTLILALWAMEEERFLLAALAAAAAAILKPPYAVVGAGFVLETLWDRRWRQAGMMSAALAICAAGLIGFNYWLARTPIISGNLVSGTALAHNLSSLYETFLEPEHGLLFFAPWVIFAPLALLHSRPDSRNGAGLARHMVIPLVLFATVVAAARLWTRLLLWPALLGAVSSLDGSRGCGRMERRRPIDACRARALPPEWRRDQRAGRAPLSANAFTAIMDRSRLPSLIGPGLFPRRRAAQSALLRISGIASNSRPN